ncbi:MAG: hypothetical protein ACOX8S_07000 [Christensenellales bacterium]|jgi:hypothetical protein
MKDSKMGGIRIVEFPKCKMAASGYCKMEDGPFEEGGKLKRFENWWSEYDKTRADRWFMRDFMMYERGEKALIWYYALPENSDIYCEYEIIDFEGGLYACDVAVLDDYDDEQRVYGAIKEWIKSSEVFEMDERPGHYDLSHGITPEYAAKAMGHMQLEIYVPIKLRSV